MKSIPLTTLTILTAASALCLAGCSHKQLKPDETAQAGPAVPAQDPVDLNMVHFAFNRSDISGTGKSTLDANIAELKRDPSLNFQIQGFCDDRGSVAYNLNLGEKRAVSVSKYLEDHGITSARISVVSFGKSHPIDPSHNEKAYAMNRRAGFSLAGTHRSMASL